MTHRNEPDPSKRSEALKIVLDFEMTWGELRAFVALAGPMYEDHEAVTLAYENAYEDKPTGLSAFACIEVPDGA